ncbi:hypothetical protein S40293_09973 [Stachybotrys chartarum IBT 40293]|nr:hypothetical protein S40293_09973 [Stachybotrys chartarum IBT 40293]
MLQTMDAPAPPPPLQDLPPLSPRGVGLVVTNIVMIVVSIVFAALRFWGRQFFRKSFLEPKDTFCYLALASVSRSRITHFAQTAFIGQIVYALTLGLCKISIAINFKAIFFTHQFRMAANGAIALSPIEINWNPFIDGHCGNQILAFTFVSVVDMITDILFLVLPVKPLIALQLRTAHKVALLVIFTGGFMLHPDRHRHPPLHDVPSRLCRPQLLRHPVHAPQDCPARHLPHCCVRPGISLIVASGPILKPVLDLVLGRILGRPFGSQTHGSNARSSGKLNTKSTMSRRRNSWLKLHS